jgi:hypothetical protein
MHLAPAADIWSKLTKEAADLRKLGEAGCRVLPAPRKKEEETKAADAAPAAKA